MAKPPPDLTLSIQYPGGKNNAPTRAQVRRWVRASLSSAAEITVRFVSSDEAQQLNNSYRKKDYATNVLSFSYDHGDLLKGDLVICRDVVEREAAEQHKSIEAHFAHLIVHGMLHLQGYDHDADPVDAVRMEAMEQVILADLGFPDPYLLT